MFRAHVSKELVRAKQQRMREHRTDQGSGFAALNALRVGRLAFNGVCALLSVQHMNQVFRDENPSMSLRKWNWDINDNRQKTVILIHVNYTNGDVPLREPCLHRSIDYKLEQDVCSTRRCPMYQAQDG